MLLLVVSMSSKAHKKQEYNCFSITELEHYLKHFFDIKSLVQLYLCQLSPFSNYVRHFIFTLMQIWTSLLLLFLSVLILKAAEICEYAAVGVEERKVYFS